VVEVQLRPFVCLRVAVPRHNFAGNRRKERATVNRPYPPLSPLSMGVAAGWRNSWSG